MDKKNIIRKTFLHLVLIHVLMSLIHLLSSDLGHPLYKFLKGQHFIVILSILVVLDVIAYFVAGMLYARFIPDKKRFNLVLEIVSITLAMFFLVLFAVVYFLSLQFYNRDIMLIYTLINPWYGTFMYKLPDKELYSLWWMISAIVPSVGYYAGAKFTLRKLGNEK